MTDDGARAPATGGGLIGSVRSQWAAARARRTARAAVDGLIDAPPADLAALEQLTGPLDVDMDGAEGRGGGVFRPESPFAPKGSRLGRLRPGIVRVAASFAFDPYHGQPRDARLLRPNLVSLSVDLERAEILRRLVAAFGPVRRFDRDGREVIEAGAWYYLHPWEWPATLSWHAHQPDWAVPPPQPDAAASLLAALAAALREDHDAAKVANRLEPLLDGTGATVSASSDVLTVTARPGLAIAAVAAAFGWEHPVAWSQDVHMTTWYAGDAPSGDPSRRSRVGRWVVELQLEGWPSGARQIGPAGAAARYDLRGTPARVAGLTARVAPDGGTPDTAPSTALGEAPPAAARPVPGAVQRGAGSPLPWYYAVNDRPVKIVPTPEGGADALVFDWATGGFVIDRSYFTRTIEVGIGKDVDSFTADEFERYVAVLRRPIVERLAETPMTWEATGDGEVPYRSSVGSVTLQVRVNDFPAAPLYSLLADDEVLADLDDWPTAWSKREPAGR